MKTILRVFAYLRNYLVTPGTTACAIATTLMLMVFPKVTQLVIDEVRAGRRDHLVTYSLIALAAFFFPRSFQRGAHRFKQHLRAKGNFRSAQRPVRAHPAAAADLVRSSRHGQIS